MSRRVIVDGNIGSGKTTQLDLLEKKGWKVHREPLDKWPLEEFYKDPSRWAFYFHMVILQTQRPIDHPEPVVYERSLASSKTVFWQVLVNRGLVTDGEDHTYSQFYDKFVWYPDLYIFLKKSPEKAFEHMSLRGQAGDSGIDLDYLRELDSEYNNLISKLPCEVIIIDAERTPEEIHEEIIRLLQ